MKMLFNLIQFFFYKKYHLCNDPRAPASVCKVFCCIRIKDRVPNLMVREEPKRLILLRPILLLL